MGSCLGILKGVIGSDIGSGLCNLKGIIGSGLGILKGVIGSG